MRNDKFHYKTEEFYLKTCNYLIDMFLDDNDELVVTPSINYFDKYGNALWGDITLPENQLDADKYFKAHFTALKKMGFNSVRIMGCQVERRYDTDILTTRLYFKNHEQGQVNPDPASNDNTYGIRDWEILTDLESENGKEFYLQAMHVVLDAAQECGLKVVWVMGWEYQYVDVNDNKTWRSLLTPPNHTINQQFCSFLHDVATEFKDNTTLICYDLFNELLSFDGEYGCSDTFQLSHSVKELVASIKATDKNHAITVGLHSISEFFHLGVEPFKHCDVYSFHIYEGNYSNHSALIGQITNRQLYYFNKTIPFPWMIGETDSNTNENTESELVQRDYAYITQQQSVNCNSLGYSWWQFYDNAPGAGANRLGLLRCDGGTENVVLNEDENNSVNIYGDYKKIVDYNNQGTAGLNISIFNCGFSQNSCEFLSNPYDYYMYPHIADNVSTHKWKGKVECDNSAIKDAVVKVSVNYPDMDGSLVDFFTFTKIDGTYEIDIPTTDYTASITVAKYGYATSAAKKNIPNWVTGVIPTSFDIVPSVLPTKENYNIDYIVSEGIPRTITKPTMIKKDIIVNNNTSLTISASVFLDDNSKIKVLPGGKLILEDGAVLSAIHQNWQGIEITGVTGNSAEIHTAGDNIIAKAVLGITSENNVIIDINNTKFINNNNDIIATGNAQPIQINNALFTTTE
ncbi:MAG: cellulase family glycosylhydrolase, partial [Bacteroidales bacterium]|nr:cellulase family glycosylhydrolase [Bacteroidales bacterium]